MYNNRLFIKFCNERNIKKNTMNGYSAALKLYTKICGLNLKELIEEAQYDERKKILKNRRLKKHLIEYRTYLIDNLTPATAKTYFSKVKTFYIHFEIEIPYLPSVKYGKEYETGYLDLPTKKDIKKSLSIASLEMRAIILFMTSSGTAKAETLSLTIQDFIDATREYHENNGLEKILNQLENQNNVVPTIYLKRIKTNKYYYTFCSPEASKEIIKYLKSRESITPKDKLFDIGHSLLLSKFQQINDMMGWGIKGNFRFFRSHTLRKFHASNIGLSAEYIDALQGRRKTTTHETYIKTNPQELKNIYMEHMQNVCINKKFNVQPTKQKQSIDINVTISIHYN